MDSKHENNPNEVYCVPLRTLIDASPDVKIIPTSSIKEKEIVFEEDIVHIAKTENYTIDF